LPTEFRGNTRAVSGDRVEPLAFVMGQFEKDYIERTLQMADGERQRAAEMLGISRKNLWEKMVKYGIH
jgi:DNA-binding NtrC family response regulator